LPGPDLNAKECPETKEKRRKYQTEKCRGVLPERSEQTQGNPNQLLAYAHQSQPNDLPQHCDNISENRENQGPPAPSPVFRTDRPGKWLNKKLMKVWGVRDLRFANLLIFQAIRVLAPGKSLDLIESLW
jgi:hypothetical protein